MSATERTQLLIGEAGAMRLAACRVAVAGLGGVGGHCAEALARAGVGSLHLIDPDVVQQSNLNRQLIATKATLGRKKTDAMRERLLLVSDCAVSVSEVFILPDTVEAALPGSFDFLVDAIDTLSGKLALAAFARDRGIPLVSCMGAGNRLDASRFRVIDVFETAGCPLARRMRQGLKKLGIDALPVVFSDEPAQSRSGQTVIGSIAPVPAAAGLCAASYVLNRLLAGEPAADAPN